MTRLSQAENAIRLQSGWTEFGSAKAAGCVLKSTARSRCRGIFNYFQAIKYVTEMQISDLDAMPLEELWLIHEQLTRILADKILAEKQELERRFARLTETQPNREKNTPPLPKTGHTTRSKYPKVLAKYRNPESPSETWSGRGKQPRWLVAALKAGHLPDEFRIDNAEAEHREKSAPVRNG
jgi:DNA-binding protein H-NS